MTADLIAFLRARLNEAREWALYLPGEDEIREGIMTGTLSVNHIRSLRAVATTNRVLRDIESRQAALEACEGFLYEHEDGIDACAATALGVLAAAYSDHPDYRQEWAQ